MSHPTMKRSLIRAALDMVAANEAHQAALAANASLLRELVRRLEDDEDVGEVVRSTPGGPGRVGAKNAEAALEEARFRFRSELVSACVATGMSRKEIASNLGCSPQLVSRYMK